jgi:hypothetical protein
MSSPSVGQFGATDLILKTVMVKDGAGSCRVDAFLKVLLIRIHTSTIGRLTRKKRYSVEAKRRLNP